LVPEHLLWDGWKARISSASLPLLKKVELYGDGSILRFRVAVANPPEPPSREQLEKLSEAIKANPTGNIDPRAFGIGLPEALENNIRFRVEDDLGTDYFCIPNGGSGSVSQWQGELNITPRVPNGASLMRAHFSDRYSEPPRIQVVQIELHQTKMTTS
jgi:hypothetical protein